MVSSGSIDCGCQGPLGKDNVFVNVVASVQYRALADKAADAFYKLSNTKGQIQSYVFDVIRASVPKLNLDAVFEQKNSIVKAVEEELEKATSAYGYEIVQTLIVDIKPDVKVKKAMTEINAERENLSSRLTTILQGYAPITRGIPLQNSFIVEFPVRFQKGNRPKHPQRKQPTPLTSG
ncbi:hypothetical protein SCA6_017357 [Theobroma cacao]